MASRPKKIKGRSVLFGPIAFLLIAAALLFGISVFFRVGSVEVAGNSVYTAEEIVEASGIASGDNLFFINRDRAVSRIYSRLPYVETADVSRSLPNRVVIRVTESRALAYVTAESGYWVIDRGCKLLSQPEAGELDRLIRVEGLTPIAPAVGQQIEAGMEDSPKVSYLSAILSEIEALGLQDDVTWIDVSNVSNPGFDYLGRFTVRLGTNENLDYKFQVLLSAVDSLSEGDRGTLDLGIDKRLHFTID